MTVEIPASRDLQATFRFFVQTSDGATPYAYVYDPPASVARDNLQTEARTTVVHDARARLGEDQDGNAFSLDIHGFQWVRYPSAEKAFVDEERIKTVYYPEVEDILREYAGAKRVFIFDHTIRQSEGEVMVDGKAVARDVARRVHCDQSFEAAERRVWYHLPDEAERLLKGRYRIINVWRPIGHTVVRDPLGFADFRTVDVDANLVSMRLFYAHREGGTFSVRYNPRYEWYWLSDQTVDEVTLIKCYDSHTDKARLTPHSAFADTTIPVNARQRVSIEVRALVFDEEEA